MMFKKIPRCTLGYRFLVVVTGAVAIYLFLLLKTNWSYDQNRTPVPQQLIQNVLNVQESSAAERTRKSYIKRTAFADGKKNQIEVLSKQNVSHVSLKTAKADTRSLTKQVQKPVNENDLKKPKYANDINSWKGANGFHKPVNGEVLKKLPDVERLNKTIEGQGGIETVDMIGSNVHEPIEGKSIHTPMHRDSVYRQLIDEHIDKPLNGDSVHKPLTDKSLNKPLDDKGLKKQLDDKGLKKPLDDKGLKKQLDDKGLKRPLHDEGLKKPLDDKGLKRLLHDEGLTKPLDDKGLKRLLNDEDFKRPLNDKNINDEGLNKPLHDERLNKAVNDESLTRPLHSEGLKRPLHGEGLKRPLHGESLTRPLHGESLTRPLHDESLTRPLHDESLTRPLHGEGLTRPLRGESLTRPLHDESLTRPWNGESLKRPWTDEGLKKSVHGSDVKITEDIPDVNGTEGTSVVNKSEHFSEVISNRVEDDSISSVIKGALGLKKRVHASGSKRKKTLAAMKSTLNKTRDVLHLNKTQNGLSSQKATKQSNSPRLYNTLYPQKAISEPGKVSGPPGARDKQTASKPKRLTDNKHNASKSKSLTDDKQIASKPESFTDDKKTPEFSNSSKSFHVSDPSKPVLCHTFSPGRLGNHLFEYASILGIAHKLNKTFFFRNDEEMKRILKYPPVQNNRDQLYARCRTAKHLQERYLCRFDENLLKQEASKDYTVDMYLQSWVYFAELLPEMKKAVTFADDIVQTATKVVEGFRAKFPNTTFVGVHNRRGDLTKKSLISQGYRVASPDFFVRALTYFRERFSRVKFLVLGEDPQWNRENIVPVNDDVIVLQPSSSPAVDIQILSLTDHMIRTVGTFGWWAAFKIPGNPTVVYLKDFVKKNSPLSTLYSKDAADYMLPEWIAM